MSVIEPAPFQQVIKTSGQVLAAQGDESVAVATVALSLIHICNVSASYRNMLYLTLTGRQDYVSNMPRNNRSFFYPSILSLIHI